MVWCTACARANVWNIYTGTGLPFDINLFENLIEKFPRVYPGAPYGCSSMHSSSV